MSDNIESKFHSTVKLVDQFIARYWTQFPPGPHPAWGRLLESVRYSVDGSGGKRFRPVLAVLTAEALGQTPERVLPYAAAVEFIHTYSLIHDDLPCMDDDDMRRGHPTNHKVFGEAVALLAGDALLTEAFALIASSYSREPQVAAQLVRILSAASGLRGMVGGQAIDMAGKDTPLNRDQIQTLHEMKTGALIASSVEGAALACGARASEFEDLTSFARLLGLAFQVADDILDSTPENLEPGSFPALMGLDQTRGFLSSLTAQALEKLSIFGEQAAGLLWITNFNQNRTH